MADLSVDSNLSGSVGTVISGSVGAVGPVTLAGLPDHYTFTVDKLPEITIGVDPKANAVTLNPVTLNPVTLTIEPLTLSVALTSIPSVRTHLPANYMVAVSLFGVEVAAVRLCGEGQIITEPYRPNPCEVCGAEALQVGNLPPLVPAG